MKQVWKRWWFWLAAPVLVGALALLTFCWTHGV